MSKTRDNSRKPLSGTDNTLVRAIGRIPVTLQRKFLVALALVAVLLVGVGVLGLGALNASNNRVGQLGLLPPRIAGYVKLEFDTKQLSDELSARDELTTCSVGVSCGANDFVLLDLTDGDIKDLLFSIGSESDVSPGHLIFVPTGAETATLREIHTEAAAIDTEMTALISDDSPTLKDLPPNEAEDVEAHTLAGNATRLVASANSTATALITLNNKSYLDSQHLFIGVAAGSVILAMLMGLALSWSFTGPLRRIDARLAAIASGDFSGRVDVANRDELGALAVNLNRTNDELGRLYGELEEASKHKSEFLANMSHELRTPLNAVIGFSEVLEGRLFGDLNEKQAEYVADIHSSGRHLLILINDILDLSKIEAGRMDLQITPVALADAVQNSAALLRERATRQGIALTLDVDASVGVVDADERMVKQVLFNLLTNALKFTPEGGHVVVSASGNHDQAQISVRDDGVGIALADQARIFEEFQQVGTSHLQEGTGLGLAISRRFVELHGGRLWVESIPGAGSTFTFTLPRLQHPTAGDVAGEARGARGIDASPATPVALS